MKTRCAKCGTEVLPDGRCPECRPTRTEILKTIYDTGDICMNCGGQLVEEKCKRRCPRCGVIHDV